MNIVAAATVAAILVVAFDSIDVGTKAVDAAVADVLVAVVKTKFSSPFVFIIFIAIFLPELSSSPFQNSEMLSLKKIQNGEFAAAGGKCQPRNDGILG